MWLLIVNEPEAFGTASPVMVIGLVTRPAVKWKLPRALGDRSTSASTALSLRWMS